MCFKCALHFQVLLCSIAIDASAIIRKLLFQDNSFLSLLTILLLLFFSKRSNFISRLPVEQRKTLHQRLYCLAEVG
jgi:hypothetical protein